MTAKMSGSGSGGKGDSKNYIPPAVLDAICKEAGKDSGKLIGWMMKGCTAAQHAIKTAKGKGNGSEDEQASEESDDGGDVAEANSTSSPMERKSTNCHLANPNPQKHHKINVICTISLQVKAAHKIDHPSDYTKLCQVEVDS